MLGNRGDKPRLPGSVAGCGGCRVRFYAANSADTGKLEREIQWIDTSGDVSPSGFWFYQIRAYNGFCSLEGP